MVNITLLNQFTPRILFDRNNKFDPKSMGNSAVDVNFDITVTYKQNEENKNHYLVEIRLVLNDVKCPVVMDIICCGIFEALKDGDDDDEDIKEALHIDAAGLLFPFLKERVLNVSAMGGTPPIIIPPIDFFGLYVNSQNNNQTKQ
jgi:preprotein translocase subunit SecB